MHYAKLRLLLLCFVLNACCAAAGYDDYIVLIGSSPDNIAGTGASDPQVAAALVALVEDRAYGPGAYIHHGGCESPYDESKIVPGPTYTYLPPDEPCQPVTDQATGLGDRQSGRYKMTLTLPEGTLQLDSDYNSTQKVINQTNKPGGPTSSTLTVPANMTFVGQLAGQSVDLSFTQDLRAERGGNFVGPY